MARDRKPKRSLTASQEGDADEVGGSNSYSRDLSGSSKSQRTSKSISYLSNSADLNAYIIWLHREFIPFTIANGSNEYIIEGTIGGKKASSVISSQPSWSKIHEIVSNAKAIERYRKDKSYLEQVKLILKEYPWGARILMMRDFPADLKIRLDETVAVAPAKWQHLTL